MHVNDACTHAVVPGHVTNTGEMDWEFVLHQIIGSPSYRTVRGRRDGQLEGSRLKVLCSCLRLKIAIKTLQKGAAHKPLCTKSGTTTSSLRPGSC